MAVELCLSETNADNYSWSSSSSGTNNGIGVLLIGSPRFSFSRDLDQQGEGGDGDDREKESERLDGSLSINLGSPANSDFDFCVHREEGSVHEHSTADELFSEGKIRPLPIQKQSKIRNTQFDPNPNWVPPNSTATETFSSSRQPLLLQSPLAVSKQGGNERLKDIIAEDGETEKPTKTSTSFWKFRRSNSLNYDGNVTSFLCSSITLLTKSKSTGSNLNPKSNNPIGNSTKKQQQPRKNGSNNIRSRGKSVTRTSSSSSTSSSSYYYGSSSCHGGPYGNNGVRISPILNVPCPHIPKGFGLFSCSSSKDKSKNNKKKTQIPAQQILP